jgi:phosphoglycolate phosphatase-like HAD superfamily hydrolase
MAKQTPQPGLAKLMNHLDSRSVRRAIVTRNFDEPVAHLLTKFLDPITGESGPTRSATEQRPGTDALRDGLRGFKPILTRSFTPAKPAPDPLLHIAQQWGLPAQQRSKNIIMVGDSKDDVESGKAAGAFTVVLGNQENEAVVGDWRITNLTDLIELLEG